MTLHRSDCDAGHNCQFFYVPPGTRTMHEHPGVRLLAYSPFVERNVGWSCAMRRLPSARSSLRVDTDPIEVGLMLDVLQPIEHPSHVLRPAMAGQHQELVLQLRLRKRAIRCAFETGNSARKNASIPQRDA